MELSKSGLVITQIDTLQFNMDKSVQLVGANSFHYQTGYRQKGVYQNSKRRQPMFQVFRPMWYMQDYVKNHPNRLV